MDRPHTIKDIEIVPKSALSNVQLECIAQRLLAPEHKNDTGPPWCWHIYPRGLFAAIENSTHDRDIIGLIEASGPKHSIAPGWWIDSKYRGKGYGKALIFSLATHLKKHGYYGVGEIKIQSHLGLYDEQSITLKKYFIECMTSS